MQTSHLFILEVIKKEKIVCHFKIFVCISFCRRKEHIYMLTYS